MIDKIYVNKKNSKQIDYTVRFIRFDTDFILPATAKNLVRKDMHISKEKMRNEYVTLYGLCIKVGRGKNAHYEFFIVPNAKNTANVIFIIPKKKKRHFEKILPNIEFR